jgi:Methyltransferase domain
LSVGARFTRVIREVVVAYSKRNRRRKADAILAFLRKENVKDVLLVGATGHEIDGDRLMSHGGIVERRIADSYEIKMGINVVPSQITEHPFMIADARDMPFEDDYVDFALANAIIEHVGKEHDQRQMVDEMTRVARCWVITTPNKWFPVESHTHTLFLHWLPSWRRKREHKFTRLLSLREFRALLPAGAEVSGSPWSPTFLARYLR